MSDDRVDRSLGKRHMVLNPYTGILVPTGTSSLPSRATTSTPNVFTAAKNLSSVTPAPSSAPKKTRFVVDAVATDDESNDNPCTRELVPTRASLTRSRANTSTPNVVTVAKNLPSVTPASPSAPDKTRLVVDAEATDDESDDIHQISSRQLDSIEKSTAPSKASVTTRVPIFSVTWVGATCTICCTKVGSCDSAIARHIRHNHPSLVRTANYAAISRGIKAAMETGKQVAIDGDSAPSLKCFICGRLYLSIYAFRRHRCDQIMCLSSHPVKVEAVKLECGRVIEKDTAKSTVYSQDILDGGNGSFQTFETTISEYVRDDEDPGTFVSLFGPLMETSKKSFESIMCDFIDRYEQPPASHEQSLLTFLAMGEKWLLERAVAVRCTGHGRGFAEPHLQLPSFRTTTAA